MMKENNKERTLTKAEMEIMNILWDKGEALTTHEIIDEYPDPKPAYSTIATFLKILTVKEFIRSKKQSEGSKTFVFTPRITRDSYANRVMKDVKNSLFDLLSSSLIPELCSNVSASTSCNVHLGLIAVSAVRALPDKLAICVCHNLDLSVIAAALTEI